MGPLALIPAKRAGAVVAVFTSLLALAAVDVAHAQTMGNRTGSTTGSTCTGGGSTEGDCRFSRETTPGFPTNSSGYGSLYKWNVNADAAAAGLHDTSGTAVHNLGFTINAPGGYRLTIDTRRRGELIRSADDASCTGAIETSGVTGSSNVALSSGTLDLPGSLSIPSGTANTTTLVDQQAEAVIYGVSNGADQPHTLSFTWDGAVTSDSCEVVVRLGETGGTTAGCSVCTDPSPPPFAPFDGHSVHVFFESLCGNGSIDPEVGETCDVGSSNGSSTSCCTATCQLRPADTVCRASTALCDAAESCDGINGTCPLNGVSPAGTVCRPTAGLCDVAETCNGSSSACPTNQFLPNGTVCRPVGGVCDVEDKCAGNSAACTNVVLNSTNLCRLAAGDCDLAEHCPGNGGVDCPADAFAPASTVCRSAAGVCDVAESCTGSGVACPGDVKVASGTSCTSDGQDCTTDECDGSSSDCQHPVVTAGVLCRASAGGCDVAEQCDGVSGSCPADAFAPSSQECRADAGDCDVAESCTGSGASCPADGSEPDGTTCSDGMSCTLDDFCVSGVCTGDSDICGDGVVQSGCAEECDDGNTDAGDGCSPTCLTEIGRACSPPPLAGCTLPFESGKAQVLLRDRVPDTKDQLQWKWSNGGLTPVAEFGDPRSTTAYQLCVYDQGGVVSSASIPAGGVCGPKFCWSATGSTGFRYVNKNVAGGGSLQLQLKEGVDGKARIQAKGKGAHLDVPVLAGLTPPVRVQLANTLGNCWEAVFSAPALRQTSTEFKDRAD